MAEKKEPQATNPQVKNPSAKNLQTNQPQAKKDCSTVPDKAGLSGKKNSLVMIIGMVLGAVLIIVIVVGVGIPVIKKINAKHSAAKELKDKEHVEEAKKEAEEVKLSTSDKPLTPAEVKEREKKLAGEDVSVGAEERLATPVGTSPAQTLSVSPASTPNGRKSVMKKRRSYKKQSAVELIAQLNQSLEKGDEVLMGNVLVALAAKGEDTVAILRTIILEGYNQATIRKNAALGLFYTGNPEAIPVLKTMVEVDPEENVRLTALFALNGVVEGDDLTEFLAGIAEKDKSEKVRKLAQEYIDTFKSKGQ
jgi:hypothetical protein